MRKEWIKGKLDKDYLKRAIDLMKITGEPFTLTLTNNTATIEGALNFKFVNEDKSVYFFAYASKVKKEVEKWLETNELEPAAPEYFDIKEKESFVLPEIINIDLTAAYLYVLKNSNVLSDELFLKLLKLPKLDRLGCIGMLAKKQTIFRYNEKGEKIGLPLIVENKQQRNVFFHCAYQTSRLMTNIKDLIQDDFIFSWVDGVYFKDKKNIEKISNLLNNFNFPFKIEFLKNFMFENRGEIIDVEFLKYDKNNKEELKSFSIPIKKNTFAVDMYNYLQNEHNEINKIEW